MYGEMHKYEQPIQVASNGAEAHLVFTQIATVFERGKLRLLSEPLRKRFCTREDTCDMLQLERTVVEYPNVVVVHQAMGGCIWCEKNGV
jgi:hypothetical protein